MARVAFLGSPGSALPSLLALVGAGHEVALVVSGPDRRRGRGEAASPTPVKLQAAQLGIPVSDHLDDVLRVGADLGVVVAFGRLIGPRLLDGLEFVNVHFSLLPRWRGAAPVERAILAGDERTGVCLMRLDEGLDTGPVYACASTAILPGESAPDLRGRLASLGADLLVSHLAGGVEHLGVPVPQVGEPTYAAKLRPEDLHIDWSAPSAAIERQVRVGRAWTTFRKRRLIVLEAAARLRGPSGEVAEGGGPAAAGAPAPGELAAGGGITAARLAPGTIAAGRVATGEGWLQLTAVQAEGRRRQGMTEWLRGARVEEGEAFQ